MTGKERLEELINRKPNRWGNLTIYEFERDIKILQEQAERVQELERQTSRYKERIIQCALRKRTTKTNAIEKQSSIGG